MDCFWRNVFVYAFFLDSMNINQFFETLASNNSRIFKLDMLKANSDNEILKKVIRLALDPFTNFYIRKIPAYTPAQPNQADTLDSVLDSLYNLYERKVTGNAGIEFLTKLLSSLTEDDAKVIEKIISKDLKCGVSISTVNTVWKKFIVDYPKMLCSGYDEKLVNKITFPAFAQRKEDGMRANFIIRNGTVEFRTRNGKELDFLGNLTEEFLSIAPEGNWVFDGELLICKDGEYLDRKTGNGILMKAQRNTLSAEEASTIHTIIWDAIPYDDFVNEKCKIPYSERMLTITNANLPEKIRFVEHNVVNSLEEAKELFEEYLSNGFEGIILKDAKGIWENKRANHQLKFKGEKEVDLKIVGIELGTPGSKFDGMLGALVCESSDGILKVNVGSGFNDEQRVRLLTENLIGKIVAVKYNETIVSKTGENSLFLPIFIEIREDKDTADSFSMIK
jgi:ATP dependent DNA ligase domain/DNA ligase OB-like domain